MGIALLRRRRCRICDCVGHGYFGTYSGVLSEATCEEGSEVGVYCEKCEALMSSVTNDDALGHSWEAVYSDSGEEIGWACTVCGALDITADPCPDENGGVHVFSHLEDSDCAHHTVACACGLAIIVPHAFVEGKCECGAEDVGGHDWSDWEEVEAATCEKGSVEHRSCNRCGKGETRTNDDALGHDWGDWIGMSPADCENGSVDIRLCNRCEAEDTRTNDDALGHDFENGSWVIVEPTCTTAGERQDCCQREGCDHQETVVLPALGHSWRWVYDADGMEVGAVCTRCDATQGNPCAGEDGHNWGPDQDDGMGLAWHDCQWCGEREYLT